MTIWSATSPGKVILFGEHAVVYGYPAIAAPVTQLKAHVRIETISENDPGKIQLNAPDIGYPRGYQPPSPNKPYPGFSL